MQNDMFYKDSLNTVPEKILEFQRNHILQNFNGVTHLYEDEQKVPTRTMTTLKNS